MGGRGDALNGGGGGRDEGTEVKEKTAQESEFFFVQFSRHKHYLAVEFRCVGTFCVAYAGNIWFVQPIDCNVQHYIFQSINFP